MAWGQGIDQRRKAGTRGWQTSPSSLPAQPKPLAWKPAPAPRSAAEAALASATDLPPLRRRPALPSGYEPPDYVVAPVRLTDGRVLHINAHDLADPRYVNVRNLNPDGTPVKGRAGLQARAVFDGAELLAPPAYGTEYRPARPVEPGLEDYQGQPMPRQLPHGHGEPARKRMPELGERPMEAAATGAVVSDNKALQSEVSGNPYPPDVLEFAKQMRSPLEK